MFLRRELCVSKAVLQHFRVALYDHKEIVEIMGHASRQAPTDSSLLRLTQLLLQRLRLIAWERSRDISEMPMILPLPSRMGEILSHTASLRPISQSELF